MTICYSCLMVFCFAFCSFLNICPLFVSFNLFCFRLIGRYVNIAVLYLRNGRKIKDNALTKARLCLFVSKRIRDASIYTSKKISLKFLFLSDIFLFPFVRLLVSVVAYRCSWRQSCRFVDNIGYIFKEVNTLQSAGACKRIEHSCPFGTSMRPEEKRVSPG